MRPRFSPAEPLRQTVLLLSAIFCGLAALFLFSPATGAAIYGFPATTPESLFFVRAIGLRDLALAAYLAGLALGGSRRALTIVLALTVIIPSGDLFLLASAGAGGLVHYLLHGSSLLCFACLSFWSWRSGRSNMSMDAPRPEMSAALGRKLASGNQVGLTGEPLR
jgi:hypothetical protein